MMESFKNSFEVVLGSLRSIYYPKSVNFLFFLIYGINNTVIMKKSSTLRFLESLSGDLKCCFLSKKRFTKLNFLQFNVRVILPFIFMAIAMTSFSASAQFIGIGKAPVKTPAGGFGIDGDANAHFPAGYENVGDWFDPNNEFNHGLLDRNTGAILEEYRGKTFIIKDRYLDDLTIFTSSNKINDNPNTYTWGPGSSPNKDEIQNVGVHFTYGDPNLFVFPATIPPTQGKASDLWCLFAGDRQVTNGSSYIDFEFLQKGLRIEGAQYAAYDPISGLPIINPATGVAEIIGGSGKFVSDGTSGGRTLGDLLVTIEFTNGGGLATVEINVWESLLGGGFGYVIHPNSEYFDIGALFITSNTGTTDVPWDVYGDSSGVYVENQWAEGAINLSAVFNENLVKCLNLETLFVRTRTTGESHTAELKDFPGAPIHLDLTPIDIVCPSDMVYNACDVTQETINTAFATWLAAVKASGGQGNITITSDLNGRTAPSYCGGSVKVTWTATDECLQTNTCSGTFTVTAPTAIGYTSPVNADKNSCEFATQADVDGAFTAWIAAQTTALEGSITGGCEPKVSNSGGTAPVLCTGGTTTVTWTITDLCQTISTITADFKLTAPTAIAYTNPKGDDLNSCAFADQKALDLAFTDWIATQTLALEGSITGGCEPKVSNGGATAPDLCKGGTTTVTWTITDLCQTISTITADFKLTAPTPLAIVDVKDKEVDACIGETAIKAAFNNWLTEFDVTGGCNPIGSYGQPVMPDLCGGYVDVTFSVTDLCENGSDTARFTVTAPTPLVVSNVTDIVIPGCTYGTQKDLDDAFALWLKGFTFSGGCKPEGVFVSTYTAPDRAIGGFIDVVYNVTDLCENGIDFARYTIQPCTNAHCTYTQGYYGNLGGMSCADGKQYTTKELIAKGLASYEGGKMTIGLEGHSVWIENTSDFIDAVIAVLPGGGASYVLSGDYAISPPIDLPSYYLRKGTLNNTLLAQTITLGLNLGIDGTLGGFALQEGTFYTAATESCNSNIPKLRECGYDQYGIFTGVINQYKFCSIDPKVIAALEVKTVQGLFDLANQALGGGSTNGLTLNEIAIAVDKINNAFDGCRLFVGYNVPPMDCAPTIDVSSSSLEKTSSATATIFEAYPIPFQNLLTVRYKFNYTSDVKIEVFNSLGVLMLTQTDANGYLDKEISLYINSQQEQIYVIKVTTNQENSVMKVISSR